ncbi:MAG: winged helix-turn-helix domain-containing protein [Methanoregulaceae archaeon]
MADLLSTIISSDKRRNVLLLLQEGPQTLEDIKSRLNVTATGMLPQLRILESEFLIQRSDRNYELTIIGKTIVSHLDPFIRTVDVFNRNKKFWREHLLSEIPEDILLGIRDLGDYQILETPDEEIFGINAFIDNLVGAKDVKGLSHTVHPRFPGFFMDLAKRGVKSSLVFTPGVYRILQEKYPGWMDEYLDLDTTEVWVTNRDFKFSYAVTDRYFSLSIFYANGIFDNKNDIISYDPSARAWGEKIHAYLLTQSEKIESAG